MDESNKISCEDLNKTIQEDCKAFFVRLDDVLKAYNPSATYAIKLVVSEIDSTITEKIDLKNSQGTKLATEVSGFSKKDLSLVPEIGIGIEEIIGACKISFNPFSINCENR